MSDLSSLLKQRLEAKAKEDAAIEERRKIDVQIVALMKQPDDGEGSVSEKTETGKVSVTFGIDRKADTDSLATQWGELSDAVKGAFRWKAEVNTKEFKALSDADRDIAAGFVESKPKSPTVKVEAA